MRKLFVLTEGLESEVIEKHGKLVLTLSLLEWFLQEAIILIILKRQFDPNQKSDLILAAQIFNSSFDKKLRLVKEFDLLSDLLRIDLDKIRKRRNVFIHGVGIKKDSKIYLQILGKKKDEEQEIFNSENINRFTDFVENVGGRVLDEFQNKGFTLEGTKIYNSE